MQQYFVDQATLTLGQVFTIEGDDFHHLVKVMRAKPGQVIQVVAANQVAYAARIQTIDKATCQLQVDQILQDNCLIELPLDVTLACGISKNDKLDWIAQKGTEGGMACLQPLNLKRDVAKWQANKAAKRIERLEKIVKEAAQQSHRRQIPQVNDCLNLTDFIRQVPNQAIKLIAFEETAKVGHHQVLAQTLSQLDVNQEVLPPLVMVFGSEGGLDIGEVEQLQAAGFKACSLGPRILRAETAPIFALGAISYALELSKNGENLL